MSFHVVNGMEYEGQEASYYFATTYLLLYTPDNITVRLISTYYFFFIFQIYSREVEICEYLKKSYCYA
jgi:hypothetical protein